MARKSSRVLVLLFPLLQTLACGPATTPRLTSDNQKTEACILFVNLKIARDATGAERIELVSKIWTDGTLKKTIRSQQSSGNLLTCNFLDSNNQILSSSTLQNPLNSFAEQYSPDGSIERKEAKPNLAYFTVRTEVSKKAASLQVTNEKGEQISLLKL